MSYEESQVETGVMKLVLEMMGDVVGLDYGVAMEMGRTGCYHELFWR